MFSMRGILDGGNKVEVGMWSTHVLGWAGILSGKAADARILRLRHDEVFDLDGVLPAIAKVVEVLEAAGSGLDECIQAHTPFIELRRRVGILLCIEHVPVIA